jgi:polar amino acid transport system permease protein
MPNYAFRWDVVLANLPFLLSGLGMTVVISTLTLVVATPVGLALALADMSPFLPLRLAAHIWGEVIRNTPILVQLLWAYYALPIVFGIGISAFVAAVIGLSVYSAAFIAEVFRAGIQAVPRGHVEAAYVLGLSRWDIFVRIILPQAIRTILPPLAANFVQLIKYSSLAAVLSVGETTKRAMELASTTFRPLEILTFLAVIYLALCWPLAQGIRLWERRLAAR